MKTHSSRCPALLVCLAIAVLAGCQHMRQAKKASALPPSFMPTPAGTTQPLDPSLLQRTNTEYRLGPGDVLQVEIIGDLTTRTRTTVGPDGKIYFNVLPGIDVWGLTVAQARDRMVQEMQRFVREPQPITVNLIHAESQRIWVLGRLNRPGVYSLTGPMTLLEAISEAGGPASFQTIPGSSGGVSMGGATSTRSGTALGVGMRTAGAATMMATTDGGTGTAPGVSMLSSRNGAADDAADLDRSFIIRQGRMLPINFERLLREGDMSQNIYLQPDDFIYLPSARTGNVHVLGAVMTPRAIDYTNQLTLLQSVALAGGTIRREAYLSHVAIVRGSLTQPQVAVVDFNAIIAGQAPDLLLEPQDIVYVPYSPYRVLNRYVDLILETFVRTVGVNEGARAVSNRAQPLGVTVPLGPL